MADHPPADLFAGGGEVRRLCRRIDWSATSLGPLDRWSPTLRTAVRAALDSPFPINLWCGPENVLIYNDAYRHVLGAKHPRALGRPGWEVWSEIWPQIGPLFEQIVAGGPPVYAEDAPFVIERREHERTPHDRTPNAWFTFSLSAIRDEAGEIVAFLNIVSETTGRVQSERARAEALSMAERAEARLREVFAQAPAFMAVVRGPDFTFEWVNDAYYQLVGHRDLISRPVMDALPEIRGQGFEQLLHSVVETGEPYVGREVSVLISRTPGAPLEQRFLDFVYYPISAMRGEEAGVVAHGYDVTEHVLAREAAQKARAEAEHANQAKSQFLANMSHEIRTPINAVVGYSDLLDADIAGELTTRQREFVARIRASSQHLLGLVNDVLDLSKIEAGEMMVGAEPAAARPIVASALQMVAPEAIARSLLLSEEWHCADSIRFMGDEDRVRQILLNLLSNALKFTPPGGSVTVRCTMADAPAPDAALPEIGPWLVLQVQDTGAGIPEEQHDRIFAAFVQADGGHTRRVGGTGLGLTISRRFARLMGGDLTVRSTVGSGSCFSLWLPLMTQQRTGSPSDENVLEQGQERPEVSAFRALGQLLLESAELIEEDLVWKLRVEHDDKTTLDRAQFADHTAAFLAAVGRGVTALDNQQGNADLLMDGSALRGMIADRHGAQRKRLGWKRNEIDSEYRILSESLEALAQRDGPKRTARDLTPAVEAMQRIVDEARVRSLEAWDRS